MNWIETEYLGIPISSLGPAKPHFIEYTEVLLQIKLPAEYREFLAFTNGCRSADDTELLVPDSSGSLFPINCMYSATPGEGIDQTYYTDTGYLPIGISCERRICIALATGAVYLWDPPDWDEWDEDDLDEDGDMPIKQEHLFPLGDNFETWWKNLKVRRSDA